MSQTGHGSRTDNLPIGARHLTISKRLGSIEITCNCNSETFTRVCGICVYSLRPPQNRVHTRVHTFYILVTLLVWMERQRYFKSPRGQDRAISELTT